MNKLWVRLAVGFLIVTVVVLASVTLAIDSAVRASFQHYVSERNRALYGSFEAEQFRSYYMKE